MAPIPTDDVYLHAGYVMDWTDKAVQAEITEKLMPYLVTEGKKGKVYVPLKRAPYVAMCYHDERNPPDVWYNNHQKEVTGYFHTLWYTRSHAVLEGTIDGKPVYVVISRGKAIAPATLKRLLSRGRGQFESAEIKLRVEMTPYACFEKRQYYMGRQRYPSYYSRMSEQIFTGKNKELAAIMK